MTDKKLILKQMKKSAKIVYNQLEDMLYDDPEADKLRRQLHELELKIKELKKPVGRPKVDEKDKRHAKSITLTTDEEKNLTDRYGSVQKAINSFIKADDDLFS